MECWKVLEMEKRKVVVMVVRMESLWEALMGIQRVGWRVHLKVPLIESQMAPVKELCWEHWVEEQ